MLTELQRSKLPNLFGVHDLNHDGVLEKADFAEYTRRIADTRGWAVGSPEYNDLLARFMAFWQGLEAVAETRPDKHVNLQVWFGYWDQIFVTPGMYDQILTPIGELVFKMLDHNNDGKVTADEYELLYSSGGLDPKLAASAFPRLDLDKDGHLSVSELQTLLGQYLKSNDPQSPGNWLFGPF